MNVSKTEIKFSSTDADLRIFIEQDNGLENEPNNFLVEGNSEDYVVENL